MKTVIILRGLSGAGKSTFTKLITQNLKEESYCVVSADDFFYSNGKYNFNPTKLPEAHNKCFENFARALLKKIETIIVDNTNSTRQEYAHYAILARVHDYRVKIFEIPCKNQNDLLLYYQRSQHNVPFDVMERMYTRWEKDPEAIIVT